MQAEGGPGASHRLPSGEPGGQASARAPVFTNIVTVAQVDSTNRLAVDRARVGAPEGLVVVADEQVSGRGRRGRRWEAPAGAGLLVSVLVRRAATPRDANLCVAALALAARAALADRAGCVTALKWPNDLVVPSRDGGRKLAGVLAEWAGEGALVVGLGCNLVWPTAASPLPAGATTVAAETGVVPDRDELLQAVLAELEIRYARLVSGERAALAEERRAASATIGRWVRVERAGGGATVGRALDVAEDGRLILSTDAGVVAVDEGDAVHLRDAPRR